MTSSQELMERVPIRSCADSLDKPRLPTSSDYASRKPVDVENSYNRLDPSNPGVDIKLYQEEGTTTTQKGVHRRLVPRPKRSSYHELIVTEAKKITRSILITGDKLLRCYLFWLPVDVRFKIYEELFTHDGSALEIGRLAETHLADLAILRTCHVIYHEASIALHYSLRYRHLFLRAYGSFSAYFLLRQPKSLRCCRTQFHDNWLLEHPCRLERLGWNTPYSSATFLIGADDPKVALRRCWDFAEFIATLGMAGALKIYSVTIVVNNNWKSAGFNEKALVKALFGGAIEILHELRLRGFTPDERGRLCDTIDSLRIPTLRIERKKEKIQGQGFSIWICKSSHLVSPIPPFKDIEVQGL